MSDQSILSLIVAMTESRVIGLNNQLPWHLSEDLKRFKRLTMGKPIIMGRKTFESIGRPLPGRQNIVLTRNPDQIRIPEIHSCETLSEALSLTKNTPERFVIGGRSVYEEALPQVDRIYLTLIHHEYPGDTVFPEFDLDRDFRIVERDKHTSLDEPEVSYSFLVAQRKRT